MHLDGNHPSVEGLLRGYGVGHGGHYVVELASVVEGENRTFKLQGDRVRIPRERVVFVQELRG